MKRYSSLAAVIAALLAWAPLAAQAQDYFVPNARPAAPSRPAPSPRPAQRPAPAPALQPPSQTEPGVPSVVENEPPITVQLPPVPELPPLPRGTAPPTAVIGVLGVPEVMRASYAAQAVDKVIGDRREKLNQDAQKEQAAWRDLQQQLANQGSTMSPEQRRTKERELQDRITAAQKQFRDRNRIIQEAAQYSVGQIERTLVAVIRQVADSRGMNLVLHRAQVALNVNEFDITEQVATQLNKILPNVIIPPDGVEPAAMTPPAAAAAAGKPAPASAQKK
jgi:Skp family chaperone for outer membrane proteins